MSLSGGLSAGLSGQLSVGLGSGGGVSAWDPAAPGALLAAYYFTEGSGSTAADSSGNGRHGTFGGLCNDGLTAIPSPTWGSGGLVFDGTNGVTLPAGLAALVKCVQFVATVPAEDPAGTMRAVLAWDLPPGGWERQWGYFNHFPTAISGEGPFPCGGVYLEALSYEPTWGTRCVTVQAGGTADAGVFNSADRVTKYLTNTGGAPPSAGSTITMLGTNPSAPTRSPTGGLVGTIYVVLLYSRDLTPEEVADNAAGLEAMVAARGVSVGYTPTETGRQLLFLGDSITAGDSWNNLLDLNDVWVKYNFGISGQTAEQIHENAGRMVYPVVSPSAAKVGVVVWCGTNDIAVGGKTPAQAFALYVQCVDDAIAAGADFVVVLPMLSREGLDASKNAFNALYAAHSWPPTVDAVATTDLPNLVPDGSSSNPTYFADVVHPNATGNQEIADAVGPLVDARA